MSTPLDTPMMRQFKEIKQQYPDALLLFRCGDFYETYAEDAVIASKVLNITLTHRNNGNSQAELQMAGFPFHALDTYLPKLVRAGMRVAICDQLEDPKLAKTLVKRGVTELVTPGVSYSDTTLQGKENNFLACVVMPDSKTSKQNSRLTGIAFLDISTGEFLVAEGKNDYIDKLLCNFSPKEVLYERGRRSEFENNFSNKYFTFELEDWMFTLDSATDRLTRQFQTQNLKGFGVDRLPNGVIAAGAILHYLDLTQHLQTGHIRALSRIEEDHYMWLDRFTIRNLELYGSVGEGGKTLLDVLDKTITPMGARMLRRWMALPLKNATDIQHRQQVVCYFFRAPETTEQIITLLQGIGDLERLASKVSTGRINPREVLQLAYALTALEPIKNLCQAADDDQLQRLASELSLLITMRERIVKTISPSAPALTNKPD